MYKKHVKYCVKYSFNFSNSVSFVITKKVKNPTLYTHTHNTFIIDASIHCTKKSHFTEKKVNCIHNRCKRLLGIAGASALRNVNFMYI